MRIKKILIAAMSVMFLRRQPLARKRRKRKVSSISHFDGMNIDEYRQRPIMAGTLRKSQTTVRATAT